MKRSIIEQYDESRELGNEFMDFDFAGDEFFIKKQSLHLQVSGYILPSE
jgi:hypothetical protein